MFIQMAGLKQRHPKDANPDCTAIPEILDPVRKSWLDFYKNGGANILVEISRQPGSGFIPIILACEDGLVYQEITKFYRLKEKIHGLHWKSISDCRNPEFLRRTLNIILQMCNAVQTLHNNEIIHRDISPSNFLVVSFEKDKYIVLLGDFECARLRYLNRPPMKYCVGTNGYAAKEIYELNDQNHGFSTDVYALAMVILNFLAGGGDDVNFSVDDPDGKIFPKMYETALWIIRNYYSAELADVLEEATRFEQENRTATIESFIKGVNYAFDLMIKRAENPGDTTEQTQVEA